MRTQHTNPKPHNIVPAAYDIQKAKQACKREHLQSREAIAWIANGELQFSLNPSFPKASAKRCTKTSRATRPKFIRCVAASRGDRLFVWNEEAVRKALLNPPGTTSEMQIDIVPIKNSIFDRDLAEARWQVVGTVPIGKRCEAFAKEIRGETSKLERLAQEVVPHYDTPNAPETSKSHNIRLRFRQLREATDALLRQVCLISVGEKLDPEIALRQGRLIGTRLAEIEAMILSFRSAKLAASIGVTTSRTLSLFWQWVMRNEELADKNPRQVFLKLRGVPDPEFPRKKMQIIGSGARECLLRGDDTTMSFKSFRETLTRHRKRKTRSFF